MLMQYNEQCTLAASTLGIWHIPDFGEDDEIDLIGNREFGPNYGMNGIHTQIARFHLSKWTRQIACLRHDAGKSLTNNDWSEITAYSTRLHSDTCASGPRPRHHMPNKRNRKKKITNSIFGIGFMIWNVCRLLMAAGMAWMRECDTLVRSPAMAIPLTKQGAQPQHPAPQSHHNRWDFFYAILFHDFFSIEITRAIRMLAHFSWMFLFLLFSLWLLKPTLIQIQFI